VAVCGHLEDVDTLFYFQRVELQVVELNNCARNVDHREEVTVRNLDSGRLGFVRCCPLYKMVVSGFRAFKSSPVRCKRCEDVLRMKVTRHLLHPPDLGSRHDVLLSRYFSARVR
jgi:hypothetical protein